ncbi:MAG: hypothetical protein WCC48_16025 [Anaeromyxobacteraceae bacterium]
MVVVLSMRAVLATALSILLVVAAIAPHVHVGTGGADECAACVASGRGAEPAKSQTPDVAPLAVTVAEAILRPSLAPVLGAPLGAVPGQSPPRA